ncbi:MAG: cyanophycin synthetase [Bacteroidetes bacterium]|nr:cyanophycin synthetase [Bacteroidota bacterium]
MNILDLNIMRGPNYWSNYRQHIIIMKLDIGKYEELPTNKIEGFSERIEKMFPSMFSHRCSEGHEGGFFERIQEGTWMGHVVEHIALEIQTLAGMECGYGRTRSAGATGIYHVIFSYEIENAGLYAAEAAIRIVESLISNTPYDLEEDISQLKRIHRREAFGPSTQSIVNEAKKRNIPYKRLNKGSMIMFGQGIHQKKIRASMTCQTASIGVDLAGDKDETKKLLKKAYIPVPSGEVISDEEGLRDILQEMSFPVVIKPIDGNHGRGITTNIRDVEQAISAFHIAKTISEDVIVERFIEGFDYRFLVINYKLVAVAKRTPAMVMGDGISSISELIEQTNTDPNRGDGHEKIMTKIKVDEVTENILADKGLTLKSILPMGQILLLKDTANMSTGGTSRDVTDLVHPDNVFMAERIARIMNLDICGIDVVAKDIDVPITNEIGGVVEVNACPGFRMHLSPAKGLPRNVAEPVMSMLFPGGKPARIPVVAITGTNGKTTTTRLVAHMAKQAGFRPGFTTTDGIYIDGHLIHYGDCTGPVSAETVLTDPTVDFAVLECARGGILRAGLGFDNCNISIVTNITEDHLGLKGIETLSEMAKVKEVVARSTFDDGYSILNADDDLVYDMREELDCNIALFSTEENNERIARHCRRGGMAATIEKGYLTITRGEWQTRICRIENVPLSFGGKASSMVKNILAATLAGLISNFSLEDIRAALLSFIPSPEFTPGRMNVFKFSNFDVMIDYAHNTGGFIELKKYVDNVSSAAKIGIITAVGDRRDEDIRNIGHYAAQMFSQVVIRHDKDLRGRPAEEITALLTEGINGVNKNIPVTVIPDEQDALLHVMNNAVNGAFIFVCTDNIKRSIDFVKELKKENEKPDSTMFTLSRVS